jgi:L-fuculose-phosphate aldolase
MYEELMEYGRMLFELGLNNSHSGNMSGRENDYIYITRHGARLSHLTFHDIVKVHLKDKRWDEGASVETKVHRAVYQACPSLRAIAHAHPPHGIVLSLKNDIIKPVDMEGAYYLPDIPVFACPNAIGSDDVAANLPGLLATHRVVMVRGHGAFAGGKTLEEAVMYISVLESASRIIFLNSQLPQ